MRILKTIAAAAGVALALGVALPSEASAHGYHGYYGHWGYHQHWGYQATGVITSIGVTAIVPGVMATPPTAPAPSAITSVPLAASAGRTETTRLPGPNGAGRSPPVPSRETERPTS